MNPSSGRVASQQAGLPPQDFNKVCHLASFHIQSVFVDKKRQTIERASYGSGPLIIDEQTWKAIRIVQDSAKQWSPYA